MLPLRYRSPIWRRVHGEHIERLLQRDLFRATENLAASARLLPCHERFEPDPRIDGGHDSPVRTRYDERAGVDRILHPGSTASCRLRTDAPFRDVRGMIGLGYQM